MLGLGFRSDSNVHRAQSGLFRVRIEARQRGWRQYNLCFSVNEANPGLEQSGNMEAAARQFLHEFFKAWEIYPPDVGE